MILGLNDFLQLAMMLYACVVVVVYLLSSVIKDSPSCTSIVSVENVSRTKPNLRFGVLMSKLPNEAMLFLLYLVERS